MKVSELGRCALCVSMAVATLAGCGSQPPIGAPGAMPQSPAIATRAAPPVELAEKPDITLRYRVLFSFGSIAYGYNGVNPAAGLIDVKGILYGTTLGGGAYGHGTVFSITTNGNEQVLHSFDGNAEGGNPNGSLIAVNGRLYGTASSGGSGYGTVFSVDTTGNNFHVLHTFTNGSEGSEPMAALVAVKGWLYGTTFRGGNGSRNGGGTVFGIRISDAKVRILHRFDTLSDGSGPLAPLTYMKGTLYGTTWQGGTYALGTVFSVDIATSGESVLHGFGGPDGASPEAGLLVASNGLLYGTTAAGGANQYGTVFTITANGKEHVLHSFGNGDGQQPEGGLIEASGELFGTTYYGGATGYGTIFRIDLSGQERVEHSFGDHYKHDGFFPIGILLNVNDTLYGTTYSGGQTNFHCSPSQYCDYGTVFALTI